MHLPNCHLLSLGEALNDKDEQCKSYGQFGLCVQEAMSHVNSQKL